MLFMPQAAYWCSAQVFHALGDGRRAGEFLRQAATIVADQASNIPQDSERAAYLDLRVNRDIRAAHEEKRWPALAPRPRRAARGSPAK